MTRTCSHKSHNKTHFLVCLYAWSSCVESNCLVVLFRMSTLDENISKFLCLYAPVYYVLLDFVSIIGSSTEKHAPTILGYVFRNPHAYAYPYYMRNISYRPYIFRTHSWRDRKSHLVQLYQTSA